jgi:hypothetical protein
VKAVGEGGFSFTNYPESGKLRSSLLIASDAALFVCGHPAAKPDVTSSLLSWIPSANPVVFDPIPENIWLSTCSL